MPNLEPFDDLDYDHFRVLYEQANRNKATTADQRALREYLETHPSLFSDSLAISRMVLEDMIEHLFKTRAQRELMRAEIVRIKAEMGYALAPVIERMLMDMILVSWLRLQYLEGAFNQLFKENSTSVFQVRFYNQCISAANLRFTRAVDTLGRLRKFNINFQVNIAAQGGQQVNIQDNRPQQIISDADNLIHNE